MARKPTDQVQLKLRFEERLRYFLEHEAARNNRSLNAEIIDRLEQSKSRLGLIEEVMVLLYGPELGKLLAMSHVHGKILQFSPGDKQRALDKALTLVTAKVHQIFESIPEKPGKKS
jgi:hypothetical protein